MRKLSDPESRAVLTLLASIGDESIRAQAIQDLDHADIEEVGVDKSRLLFHIAGLKRGVYRGQDSFRGLDGFPVEGRIIDSDRATVEVYLFHVNNRLYEVELLRPDGLPIGCPDWQTFELT